MAAFESSSLVDTAWLAAHLNAPDIVIVDASWHLPSTERRGHDEYLKAHIAGARFFDIDAVCDQSCDLPHMMPGRVEFASSMRKLGIGDGVRVIAYDSAGIFGAARVWWMLRVMGHRDVSVLNGGLAKWQVDGHTVTTELPGIRPATHFTPREEASLVVDTSGMERLSDRAVGGEMQIVDARPAGRFAGQDPEPRAGLRMGHIPGSRNVPFASVLNDDGTMKSADDLSEIFKAANINPGAGVTATCGSGVSAAVLALALAQLGNDTVSIYDGSWAEWGAENSARPVALG